MKPNFSVVQVDEEDRGGTRVAADAHRILIIVE
jgi:hypothetical protein